ncbi:hypothetical protein EYF80_001576 [Liparis tanakae]|uniref:Uncharacterized protein n=1 Tax=Liparis tanakae TaxID=230148 RepID=A0A4Z2JCG4_9TELE|nr:hypothetical protein EYF80_001576 [Liparis tanakae]
MVKVLKQRERNSVNHRESASAYRVRTVMSDSCNELFLKKSSIIVPCLTEKRLRGDERVERSLRQDCDSEACLTVSFLAVEDSHANLKTLNQCHAASEIHKGKGKNAPKMSSNNYELVKNIAAYMARSSCHVMFEDPVLRLRGGLHQEDTSRNTRPSPGDQQHAVATTATDIQKPNLCVKGQMKCPCAIHKPLSSDKGNKNKTPSNTNKSSATAFPHSDREASASLV